MIKGFRGGEGWLRQILVHSYHSLLAILFSASLVKGRTEEGGKNITNNCSTQLSNNSKWLCSHSAWTHSMAITQPIFIVSEMQACLISKPWICQIDLNNEKEATAHDIFSICM